MQWFMENVAWSGVVLRLKMAEMRGESSWLGLRIDQVADIGINKSLILNIDLIGHSSKSTIRFKKTGVAIHFLCTVCM